eukprot:scaffold258013_cov16-Tisochrysis_lutea.AAC.1
MAIISRHLTSWYRSNTLGAAAAVRIVVGIVACHGEWKQAAVLHDVCQNLCPVLGNPRSHSPASARQRESSGCLPEAKQRGHS